MPRRINLLCDRALLGAYVENSPTVTRTILRRAADEVFVDNPGQGPARRRWPVAAAALAAGIVITGAAAWQLMPAKAPPPAAVAPRPRPAPAPVLAAVPAAHTEEQLALRELALLWGEPLPEGEACAAALKLGLRCHQGKGGLYELRLLDRPAILTLRDGANVSYAVLAAMDEGSVTLQVGGKRHKVGVAALAPRFDGAYTTFWKMPRYFRDQLGAGERGADVDWIATSLAQLGGVAAPRAGEPLGKSTQQLLRQFQAKNNLKADGVAGPRTYMRLNQLAGVQEPRVVTGKH